MIPLARGINSRSRTQLAFLLVIALITVVGAAVAGPLAALLLVVALVGIYGAAFAPGVTLAIYLFIGIYKGGIPAFPIDITVVLAVLNFLQVIPVLSDRQPRDISRAGVALWLMLGLLTLGGVLYAPDKGLAIDHVAHFWALVILPIVPAAIRVGSAPRYLHQFLWGVFAMGLPMVAFGIPQLSSSERLAVLGANTIEVALAALLVPLVGIAFVLPQRRAVLTAAMIVLIPASLVVAIASGSRGPLLIAIALGLFGAVRLISHLSRVNWRVVGAVGALTVASFVVVTLAGPELPDQSTSRFTLFADFVQRGLSGDLNTAVGDTSAGIRVQLFGLAVSLFDERPLLGVGPAGFEALSPRFLSPLEAEAYPHNAFLQFAAEYGLVGLAISGSLVVLAMSRALPASSSLRTLNVLFAFFFLNAMVSGDIFGDRSAWGLLMLLLLIDPRRLASAEGPALDDRVLNGRLGQAAAARPSP